MARKNSFIFEIPAFQYPGGKAKAAKRFIRRMPRSGKVYCEPFAGRANVFFRVRGTGFKFGRWVLNDPTTADFLRAILDPELVGQMPYKLTGTAATEMNRRAREDRDPVCLLMNVRLGYSGGLATTGRIGDAGIRLWNRGGRDRYRTTLRCARRLLTKNPSAEITDDDGLDWIKRARQDWFLYVDPPYLGCAPGLYGRCDGQEEWHAKMIGYLLNASSRGSSWMLSGYRTDLYVRILGEPSWTFSDYRPSGRAIIKGKRDSVVECVWQR